MHELFSDLSSDYFSNQTVLVVGDFMVDKYLGGDVNRISPEAPVPVLNKKWSKSVLGGAGNVINNLHSLGANTRALTCIGIDDEGDTLIKLLSELGCDTDYVMRDACVTTTTKTRIVARNQQVIRVDDEVIGCIPLSFFDAVRENIVKILGGVSAVIISDYGKGILSREFTTYLIAYCNNLSIPTFVDPKGSDWSKYRGATMCTPNLKEFSDVCGYNIAQDMEEDIEREGKNIVDKYSLKYVIVTRSEKGISYISPYSKKDFLACKKEIVDVSGAGDTVISVIALTYASGKDIDFCCLLANRAAAIVVSKFGTATSTLGEIIGYNLLESRRKIIEAHNISYLSNYLHKLGKKIVFTNGCFDLLHCGHIDSLEQARRLGDVLIVGVNSDSSVKQIKGEARPIIMESHRVYMLQALSVVDYVVIFDDITPEKLIKEICPDVLVKGEDYSNSYVVGREFVEQNGGHVTLIKFNEDISTSKIIKKIIDLS